MSVQLHDESEAAARAVAADLEVAVSRNDVGSLADGVRERLASADGVAAVESFELAGIQPGLNDLTVDVAAELRLAADVEEPAARLSDSFGVSVEHVEPAAAPRGPPDDPG